MHAESSTSRLTALARLHTAALFWAVNPLVARAAPGHIEPNLLALLRWLIAGLLFALPARAELWVHRNPLRTRASRWWPHCCRATRPSS